MPAHAHESPAAMLAPMAVLAACCVFIGLAPARCSLRSSTRRRRAWASWNSAPASAGGAGAAGLDRRDRARRARRWSLVGFCWVRRRHASRRRGAHGRPGTAAMPRPRRGCSTPPPPSRRCSWTASPGRCGRGRRARGSRLCSRSPPRSTATCPTRCSTGRGARRCGLGRGSLPGGSGCSSRAASRSTCSTSSRPWSRCCFWW